MEKGIINAKKYGNRCLLICFVIALLFLCSCSARKVEKSKTETKETVQAETTKVDSSKTTTIANSNVKIIDSSSTDEVEVMPLDNTKEMVVNGKTYFNVHLKQRKVKNNITTNKTENVAQIKQNNVETQSKLNSSKHTKSNGKFVDKQQYDWTKTIILIFMLLILIILCLYCYYKKYGLR